MASDGPDGLVRPPAYYRLPIIVSLIPGALETAVCAGGANDPRVLEATRLVVRAERVAAVRYYISSKMPMLARPDTLDQLVAPAQSERTSTSTLTSPKRTASARRAASALTHGGAAPLTSAHVAMLPVTARRKAERAVAAVLASQWETAADMFDEARDAANAEPSATAAAAALDVMYAFALASDPTSRDKAEAWSVVHEYARKVTELQLACEPLLLLVLARLEHGDVTHAAPPARSRQRSADSYAFLALFAHKTGIWHAPKASAADVASAAAASGAVGAVAKREEARKVAVPVVPASKFRIEMEEDAEAEARSLASLAVEDPARFREIEEAKAAELNGAGASGAIGIAAEGVGVNGDGGVNGHGGACFSVELGLTGRSVLTELELREIREADEARELELISDAQRQGEASSSVPILPSRSWSGALGPEARWQRKADEASSGDGDPTLPSSALDTLMALRGLHHVKNIALELHTRVMAERRLPPAMRVKTSLNFSLMGNPGTGKTTVAKLLGQLLHELGLRSSTTFVSTSGEAMLRECPKKIPGLIASADNGVLFIDEAYQLDPAKNSEGKAIVNQLLTAAEEKRETLSIIFAGYKDDTEEKLYAYSCGLQSRFRWPRSASDCK